MVTQVRLVRSPHISVLDLGKGLGVEYSQPSFNEGRLL